MNCYKCHTPIPDNSHFCSVCGADVSGEHGHEETVAIEQDPQLVTRLQAELGTEYILEKELGRGGMAIVYLGRDAHLGRQVAVKVLPPELTYGSRGSMIERFKREAQTAAKLDHPNIIPVYRVAPGGTLFWYVMKYLDGDPLDKILEREGQQPVERTVAIISQVADALEYAHQNQVVHRDVKPANVVVDKKGRVTVTDFGIAKALDANTLTASGSIIGTPYYMSPEQCKGKRVGPAADQYSLAVMAYQMLGGHLPFTGDSAVEIVHKHVADPVPPLGVLRPQLPEKVVAVVERGLAKAPEHRFPTVTDFARALKATSEGLDIPVAVTQPDTVRVSKTALVSPVPGALRTARGAWRTRKRLLAAAGAVVIVAAAATTALVLRGTSGRVEPPPQGAGEAQPVLQTPDVTGPAGGAQLAVAESVAARPRVAAAAPPPAAKRPAGPGTTASRTSKSPQQPPSRPSPGTQAGGQAAAPATREAAPPPARQPAPTRPAPPVGYISLGTQPVSTIYVNGEAKGSRLVHLEIPAGTVRLRFKVQDSSGVWWARDREVTLGAGEHKVLGYLKLVRP